jgi:hypothetical protein
LSSDERRELASAVASGRGLLVFEEEFEQLDPTEPLEPLGPVDPLDPPPPIDPTEDTEPWISFEVVDEDGQPVPFLHAHLLDPAGAKYETPLDAKGTATIHSLTAEGVCTLTLTVNPEEQD